MINSILNEGARGLQNSQREFTRAASDIARAGTRPDNSVAEIEQDVSTPLKPIQETVESEPQQNISESLIELRRQELVFDASAQVVSSADQALGGLLDTKA